MKSNREEIRTTYSFRASKEEIEAIKLMGEGSISKGIRNYIDFHNSHNTEENPKAIIKKVEDSIKDMIFLYGDTKAGIAKIKKLQEKLSKYKIKCGNKKENDVNSLFRLLDKEVLSW